MEASEQAAVDTLTSELGQVATDLHAASVKLQSEINALATTNPQLDLTALQAAAAPLDAQAQALAALVPDPAAPAPVATAGQAPGPAAPAP